MATIVDGRMQATKFEFPSFFPDEGNDGQGEREVPQQARQTSHAIVFSGERMAMRRPAWDDEEQSHGERGRR